MVNKMTPINSYLGYHLSLLQKSQQQGWWSFSWCETNLSKKKLNFLGSKKDDAIDC
jgi:hypothetical protein